MVEVFEAGKAMHFSPKDLGLNVGFLGLFLDSLELNSVTVFRQFIPNLWTVFGQSGVKFLGLFWAVLGLISGLLLVNVC